VPGVDGVKTGTTDEAGENLVASVTREGHRALVIGMGTKNRAIEVTKLINYAFSAYTWQPLPAPANLLLADSAGRTREVTFYSDRTEMVPRWQRFYLAATVRLDRRNQNPPAGTPVGTASYAIGGVRVADVSLAIR
jgi:D-alanyl-D-alanine carboxypeptidase